MTPSRDIPIGRFLLLVCSLASLLSCGARDFNPWELPPVSDAHAGNLVEIAGTDWGVKLVSDSNVSTAPVVKIADRRFVVVPAMAPDGAPYRGSLRIEGRSGVLRVLHVEPLEASGSVGDRTLSYLDQVAALVASPPGPFRRFDGHPVSAAEEASRALRILVPAVRSLVESARTATVAFPTADGSRVVVTPADIARLDAVIAGAAEPPIGADGRQVVPTTLALRASALSFDVVPFTMLTLGLLALVPATPVFAVYGGVMAFGMALITVDAAITIVESANAALTDGSRIFNRAFSWASRAGRDTLDRIVGASSTAAAALESSPDLSSAARTTVTAAEQERLIQRELVPECERG